MHRFKRKITYLGIAVQISGLPFIFASNEYLPPTWYKSIIMGAGIAGIALFGEALIVKGTKRPDENWGTSYQVYEERIREKQRKEI